MSRITAHEILTKINVARLGLRLKDGSGRVHAAVVDVDAVLLDLQEKLLDDYGNEPQTRELA